MGACVTCSVKSRRHLKATLLGKYALTGVGVGEWTFVCERSCEGKKRYLFTSSCKYGSCHRPISCHPSFWIVEGQVHSCMFRYPPPSRYSPRAKPQKFEIKDLSLFLEWLFIGGHPVLCTELLVMKWCLAGLIEGAFLKLNFKSDYVCDTSWGDLVFTLTCICVTDQ